MAFANTASFFTVAAMSHVADATMLLLLPLLLLLLLYYMLHVAVGSFLVNDDVCGREMEIIM